MTMLLAGGIGVLLVGLLAIGFGIQDKEFEVGKTLILSGSIFSSAGLIMLGLLVAVRELKAALRSGSGAPAFGSRAARTPELAPSHDEHVAADEGEHPLDHDLQAAEGDAAAPPPAPWQAEIAARARTANGNPPPPAAEAEPKRRNLLFSSTSRKERERERERTGGPAGADQPAPAQQDAERAPATFEDAWPQPERTPPELPRRSARTPATFHDAPRPPAVEAAAVTVLKSGVVDGMAYSLYSDGSIEAQMPEGMMRFASIDELRTHLDQRS